MRVLIYFCFLFLQTSWSNKTTKSRQRRYLLFTPATQYGVLLTVALPLEAATLTSVAWFVEVNYYNVDNVTYFQPLLGDIPTISRGERSMKEEQHWITRTQFYQFLETMFEKHGYPGGCLLRIICENAHSRFLAGGLVGDLLHLVTTPSSSMFEEDLPDRFYEAEYRGLDADCEDYAQTCPEDPLSKISMYL